MTFTTRTGSYGNQCIERTRVPKQRLLRRGDADVHPRVPVHRRPERPGRERPGGARPRDVVVVVGETAAHAHVGRAPRPPPRVRRRRGGASRRRLRGALDRFLRASPHVAAATRRDELVVDCRVLRGHRDASRLPERPRRRETRAADAARGAALPRRERA
eukprot:30633-Pelagococcus_subviridis.AAC.3